MSRPGDRLRAMAARVCGAKTMERLIDPLVADLQSEYAAAVRRGHVWRSRWVRVAGYAAFSKVIAFCALQGSLGTLHDGIEDDRQTLRRTIAFSISGIIVATLLLLVLSLPTAHVWTRIEPASQLRLVVYLAPQTLPLAVPVGLLLGILYGLAGRAVSPRSQGRGTHDLVGLFGRIVRDAGVDHSGGKSGIPAVVRSAETLSAKAPMR